MIASGGRNVHQRVSGKVALRCLAESTDVRVPGAGED
jgi:hypothetical protein